MHEPHPDMLPYINGFQDPVEIDNSAALEERVERTTRIFIVQ
jgi:hypothetical protein